jgi:GTPase SAR1 family protein
VGKTSIISRFINNTFQANNMSTTGASFAAKTMYFEKYDKTVKFEVSLIKNYDEPYIDLGYSRSRKI